MNCWCGGETINYNNEYLQCEYCGTFVSKIETPNNFYDFKSFWYERQTKVNGHPDIEKRSKLDFFNRIPFWWEQIKNLNIQSILEIGCGHGGFLHYCEVNGVNRCLGVEVSEGTCDFARKTFNLDIVCGSFPNIEINEKFDLVCGFDVVEHLSNPVESLTKMKSLGKYVMVQIPVYRGEKEFKGFIGIAHLFIFTEHSIRLLFKTLGLKIISCSKGCFDEDLTIIGEAK